MVEDKELQEFLQADNPDIVRLTVEVIKLKSAIQDHKANTGHKVCWLNDQELWRALEENPIYPHDTLPVKQEFLNQCEKYYQSRLEGTEYEDPEPTQTVRIR